MGTCKPTHNLHGFKYKYQICPQHIKLLATDGFTRVCLGRFVGLQIILPGAAMSALQLLAFLKLLHFVSYFGFSFCF